MVILEMIDVFKEKNNDMRIAFDKLCRENAKMMFADVQKITLQNMCN